MKASKHFLFTLISFLIMTLLVINLFKAGSPSYTPVTFGSTLEFISNTGSSYTIPNVNAMIAKFTIEGEWAILDGFRIFLNGLGSILGIVAWVVASLIFTLTFAVKLMFFILG